MGKYSKYLRLSFASQRVVLTSDRILERLNTNRFSRFESPVTNHPSVDDIQQFNYSVRQRLATLHRVSTEMNDAEQRRLLSAMAVKLERNQQLGRWSEGMKVTEVVT